MLATPFSAMPPAASSPPVTLPGSLPPDEIPSVGAASAFRHEPVLLAEVLDFVPAGARLIVDATLGGAGHARAILDRFPNASLLGCDRDPAAIEAARATLAPFGERVLLRHARFSEIPHHVLAGSVDFLLADLGVSSPQLDVGARGFSFTHDGPLDMRMDPGAGRTAAHWVNRAKSDELLRILYTLGEERFAPRIVRAIETARAEAEIETTGQLARLVAGAVPKRFHKPGFHPATQTFQALRMAVNDEIGELGRLLAALPDLLAPGGRAAIIAFHSLEDRPVKDAFRAWEQPCICPPEVPRCVCGKVPLGHRLTRKPTIAGAAETQRNPRARSAKLRVFEKAAAAVATSATATSRPDSRRERP
jgi:16S rRNA (cytosine1402-N4)-methyltransferase